MDEIGQTQLPRRVAAIIRMFHAIISEARIELATNMEITPGGVLPPPPQAQQPLPNAAPGQPLPPSLAGALEALILAINPPVRAAQGNASYSIEIALSGERLQLSSTSYFPPGTRLLLRALSDSRLRVEQVLPAAPPVLVKAALRNALPAQLPVRDALLAIRELGGDAALPNPVRQRIAELLMRLPIPAQAQSPRSLRELVLNSGLLLEGRLRASATTAAPGNLQAAANAGLAAVTARPGGQALSPASVLTRNQSTAPADEPSTPSAATGHPDPRNAVSAPPGGRTAAGMHAILRLMQRFSGPASAPATAAPPRTQSSAMGSGAPAPTTTYDARGQLGPAGTPPGPGERIAAGAARGALPPDSTSPGSGLAISGEPVSVARKEALAGALRTANPGAPAPRESPGITSTAQGAARSTTATAAVRAPVSRPEVSGSAGAGTGSTPGSPGQMGDARNALPVNPVSPRLLSHDFKAQLLSLLELLAAWPSGARSPTAAQTHSATPAPPALATPLLYTPRGHLNPGAMGTPATDAGGFAQPPGNAPGQRVGLSENATPEVQHLLIRYVEAALARTRIHQIAGLPEARQANDNAPLASWTVEIPLQRGQQLDLLEMRVEDHGEQPSAAGQALRLWQLMMTLDIDVLGPMHAYLQLAGNRLSATLWAERSSTLEAARSALRSLVEALETQGVEVTQLECLAGRPPASQSPLFERLLDVHT